MFLMSSGSRSWEMKPWVVLQDWAKACVMETSPRAKLPSLGMTRPSISAVAGQATVESGTTVPRSRAAAVVTVLKVEPGGYSPLSETGPRASAASFCATAMTPPVEALRATIAAGCSIGSRARFAAVCTPRSIVVRTGSLSAGSTCPRMVVPVGEVAWRVQPASAVIFSDQ